MTRKSAPILVFQHTETEHLGHLEEPLRSEGAELHVYHRGHHVPPDPALAAAFGAIVSLGGPMSANDAEADPFLGGELAVLEAAIGEDVSVLGICLGAQLLARALGAAVHRNEPGPEIGWAPITLTARGRQDPLLAGFGPTETVFHWHQETFDLPRGTRLLASSGRCERQAFAHGTARLGLQFHVELDARMADDWAAADGAGPDLAAAGTDYPTISEGSLRHGGRQVALARLIGRRFALLARGLRPDQSGAIRL